MNTDEVPVDKVLEFLSEWRTSPQIIAKFKFSIEQWQNYQSWLRKGKFIRVIEGIGLIEGKTNRVILYHKV